MDLIKETYDLLNHHLGIEQRGRKQLGSEHDELKKDVQKLVIHALKLGKVLGAQDIKFGLAEEYGFMTEIMDKVYVKLRQEFNTDKYESKAKTDVSE